MLRRNRTEARGAENMLWTSLCSCRVYGPDSRSTSFPVVNPCIKYLFNARSGPFTGSHSEHRVLAYKMELTPFYVPCTCPDRLAGLGGAHEALLISLFGRRWSYRAGMRDDLSRSDPWWDLQYCHLYEIVMLKWCLHYVMSPSVFVVIWSSKPKSSDSSGAIVMCLIRFALP